MKDNQQSGQDAFDRLTIAEESLRKHSHELEGMRNAASDAAEYFKKADKRAKKRRRKPRRSA